jgi:hypothetical protein
MSVERVVLPGQALEWSPQTAAAVAALVVLVWALLDGQVFWPTWPLWVIAALLVLGLVTDQLARGQVMRRAARGRALRESAQPVAATTAMVVTVWHLTHASSSWPTWPLWVVAALLGLGLIAAVRTARPSDARCHSCAGKVQPADMSIDATPTASMPRDAEREGCWVALRRRLSRASARLRKEYPTQ